MIDSDKTKNIVVSVIVPVYRCEAYIGKCIDSCLAQTFADFELLLVLDGSVDSSPTICREYAMLDSRIRVFEQENQGVSAARNRGLDNAAGKYVLFVDSDDWVEPDYLERMVESAEASGADVVICGYYAEAKYEAKAYGFFSFDSRSFPREDGFFLCCSCLLGNPKGSMENPAILGNPWAKLYRRDLLERHDIRFPVGMQLGEDIVFNLRPFWYSERSVLIQDHLYHYRVRDDSISRAYNPGLCDDLETICGKAWDFRETINDPDWELVCMDRWLQALFEIIKSQLVPSRCPLSRGEKIRKIKELVETEDAPYKRVRGRRKTFLSGNIIPFWYLLRLRQYWFVYLYCELKYKIH